MDSDGSTCSKATFTFGGGSTSRNYDIKVPSLGVKIRNLKVDFKTGGTGVG